MVPGGDTHAVIENATLEKILQMANAANILIGAICAGPLLLAKAGILKGRKFTHGFGDHYQDFLAPYWDGADSVDESVVVDGNIVTAKPEAHIDFGVMLARMTEAIADDKLDYYRSYYKGHRLPE
jgi:putative intracellular protease/amidase